LPENESARLGALKSFCILDTGPEECFDRLVGLAATMFDVPISLISFVDSDRQFIKSAYGLELCETSREDAFCAHSILGDKPMVVPDATQDPRFSDNRLVVGEPYIRFYAGAPLITSDGLRLGTICVIDKHPRPALQAHQLTALENLAAHVVELLEFRLAKRHLARTRHELAEQVHELARQRDLWSKIEQRATMAMEAGRIGYWEREAGSDRVSFSPMLEEMLELDHGTYDGSLEGWMKCIDPADHETVLAGIEEAQRTRENCTFKYRVRTADGSERWITTTGTYKYDEAGNFVVAQGVSWDSTAAEIAARELKRREELFRGLCESAPAGVFRADCDSNVTYANSQFGIIFGLKEEELLGHGWLSRIHPADKDELRASVDKIKSDPQRTLWENEHRLLMADGTVRWVRARLTLLRDQHGHVQERVGTVFDTTQVRKALDDLQEAKEAAELANQAKDHFLANVSHELRTPLNGVLGMNEQLIESGLSEQQLEMARLVQESARGLLTVVNDILDLTRIESGKLTIERVPFQLRALVQQSVALCETEALRKNLPVKASFSSGLGDCYIGDATRIKQILLNYLANAVKFTQAGEIRISAHAEVGDHGTELHLMVSDSGPGIALEAQSKLFLPFSQIDDSSTRRNGGVGLGLAICKRLAELMGGRVGVVSAPDKGSTFWVSVPVELLSQPIQIAPQNGLLDGRTNGRVLLVEDNLINQRVASGALRKLGWEADVAGNGKAAIDLFQKSDYSLVLMDCQMPELDGYAATKQIRRWEDLKGREHVPIIALTAHAMSGDKERCLEAGMNDYLAKPFGFEELRQALERWATIHV